jgi:hypothetical protein
METPKDFDLNRPPEATTGPTFNANYPDGVPVPPDDTEGKAGQGTRRRAEDPDYEQYQQEHQLWPEMDLETEE